ncbi:putative endonuclease [Curtobacterium sp. UNCCL20]|uniref:YraN family protein n=1 Tax=Curtobacterium sp. UNCCL20 TaxID=1502773 RepID=UPI00088036D6|nr:YraN family protein [Curtobacterium sp. UNCCL20]SDQ83013.1 putative endonuclease [Curtobacterium sp. UNCCL20]
MERTPLRNSSLGRFGEDRAVEWLEDHGFRVVERNWRCPRGEVDIIAWQSCTLVFIEVKTRSGISTGHPFEAITASKVARMRRLVPASFDEHPEVSARAIRIDAVAVHVDADRVGVDHIAGVL